MVAANNISENQHPLPVYVIFGSDDFLRARRLEEVLGRLLGDDRDNMALAMFEGATVELAEVLDECRTPSLLAPIRVVCVQEADAFVSAHRKVLEDYIQSPSPTGILLLVCRKWPKTTRLYKQVDKLGGHLDCEPPKKRYEFVAWAADHARSEYGCTLMSGAADRLVDLVGDHLGLLNMELAKLATYVAPGGEIRLEDIEEMVGASRAETVFRITDAVAQRDVGQALALWDQVLATDRDASFRAVGGLAYGFRRLAEAKRMVSQGVPLGDVRAQLRIWSEPTSLARQLDRFSMDQWQGHLVKLLQIDMGAKAGLGTVKSSVEKFIVELCAAS
ncbi:MAG: DNA polymerase III subunit delta [Phycisphaerales bacterium]|nr:DNA polymerase III subunit delta [Phycisphaerales bacterium]